MGESTNETPPCYGRPLEPVKESLESRAKEWIDESGYQQLAGRDLDSGLVTPLVLNAPGLARAQPQVKGQWVTVLDPTGSSDFLMPVNPIHAGLLRTGNVLVIAGSGNYPKDSVDSVYKAAVWDPVAGTVADQNIPWDIFCNGMSFLPDGRAFDHRWQQTYPD